ncbi:MAG: MoxR family ATPase [Proteobacteria bacterium]|nr:MoxR family ATPase [Pseudomonadota bacterium]NOG59591.1 MoxR family ATPase [Pseudomonadota bacterium]
MQQLIYRCFNSIEHIEQSFAEQNYICDRKLATTIFLSTKLGKPLFLEGEPGVGKTEVAKVLSKVLDTKLIRLQCYEGLDTTTALYEWNYPRQMLELRLQEARDIEKNKIGENIFSEAFLFKRPLLQAIQSETKTPPVLLIDEIDRSDEEFEAFLLEVLSDFQITIPELGTIKAKQTPIVILTSNNTRQLHDALKRRCLFNYIDYPDLERERLIVKTRVPNIQEELSEQICEFMQWIRSENLYKRPGIAETIDWAEALLSLGIDDLTVNAVEDTISCIIKYKQDLENIQKLELSMILEQLKNDEPKQHLQ